MGLPLEQVQEILATRSKSFLVERGFDQSVAERVATSLASPLSIDQRDGPHLFKLRVCDEGVTVVRYDLKLALGAAIACIGGVVGANAVSAAMAVLGAILALRGARTRPHPDTGRVLLALNALGAGKVKDIKAWLDGGNLSLSEMVIRERLADLLQDGAVAVDVEVFRLTETMFVTYALEPEPTSAN